MKIFYSWQSDTPNRIGRSFIREALDDAIEELKEKLDVDEAKRIEVDQDTQGVLGSPSIAETILRKIQHANVFVADVTLVGLVDVENMGDTDTQDAQKKLINSNVAIEYGFAMGCHGDEVLLPVMNNHFGSFKELPFDLNHKRKPVEYCLSPSADKAAREKEKSKLAKHFSEIIKAYLGSMPDVKDVQYQPVESTMNAASYWGDGKPVVSSDVDPAKAGQEVDFGYSSDQPLIYLRMWPSSSLPVMNGRELGALRSKGVLPFLMRSGSSSYSRNGLGFVSYAFDTNFELMSSTQIFQNREIWGVDGCLLERGSEREKYTFDYIPTGALLERVRSSLSAYLKLAATLDYLGEANFEFGLVNVNGFKLVLLNNYSDRFSDKIFGNVCCKLTVALDDANALDKAFEFIREQLFDAVGMEVPNVT